MCKFTSRRRIRWALDGDRRCFSSSRRPRDRARKILFKTNIFRLPRCVYNLYREPMGPLPPGATLDFCQDRLGEKQYYFSFDSLLSISGHCCSGSPRYNAHSTSLFGSLSSYRSYAYMYYEEQRPGRWCNIAASRSQRHDQNHHREIKKC